MLSFLPPPPSASINLELGSWGNKVDDPDGKQKRVIPFLSPIGNQPKADQSWEEILNFK